ncbi:hypothetical protein BKA61DRAFT_597515 [Leptodontidium sp. MPI-SDFR-AT-0119]|nr:hypothetical protein BKA61DRAFT_597515 [Leptodontidium sp. MPI-SDFR-AT-0119]
MPTTDAQKPSTLSRRGLSSFGGYALNQRPCPADTSTCGSSSCCPTGYSCDLLSGNPTICCPSSDADCRSTVGLLPACADNSWDLYDPGFAGPAFCCLSDAVGAGSFSSGYRCLNNTLPIPTSLEVPKGPQATGARTTQVSSVTTGKGSSSTDSSSTNGGGNSSPSNASSNLGDSSRGGSLPTGAIVAIAILATLVVILLVALAIGWFLYKKRQRKRVAQGVPVTFSQPGIKAEPSVSPGVVLLPDARSKELSGETVNPPVHELNNPEHVELDGSRRTQT